jgi:phage tail sheath protein FI
MAVTPALSYPGVYIQEVPSGVRTIVGVGTSVGMFIGASKRGPIGQPVRCLNYTAFRDAFGDDPTAGQLAWYVKLFFLNGGTDCWVMRIANGAAASRITLLNESGANPALILRAKEQGAAGDNIRAIVTYGGAQPEATFNLELYTWELQGGVRVKTRREVWKNLSMNSASASYAPDFLKQNSALVDADEPPLANRAPLVNGSGISQSGRPVPYGNTDANLIAAWNNLIGAGANARHRFQISVDGSPFVDVDLANNLNLAGTPAQLATSIANTITVQAANQGVPGLAVAVTILTTPPAGTTPPPSPTAPGAPTRTSVLRFASTGTGDVYIRPATADDLAVPLMLGSEQGGLEISALAVRRPAPSGITLTVNAAVWPLLASLLQNTFNAGNGITLEELTPAPNPIQVHFLDLVTNGVNEPFYVDNAGGSPNGNNDGVRDKLARMAAAINAVATTNPNFRWHAEAAGYRLTILPTDPVDDNFLSGVFAQAGFAAGTNFLNNVHAYSLGPGGLNIGARQTPAVAGSDGNPAQAADYDAAYLVVEKEVDLFNLMVLPPIANPAVPIQSVYGNASVFCQQRRAFLIMDPPSTWTTPQNAVAGLTALRTGLVKDYSAVFYPRITIDDRGLQQNIGPAGAMAGLFGRIDGTRGVWKAPAGTEADLRGIVGLEQRLSDRENGVLNPRAINTLRVFPSGIVSWGARTNDGDDNTPGDYKYIPIRRLALFIEESLYRGLKWVVFEPNDEPLWAQIRLNVGAFMHNLFRQGAFQGATPRDAYFVKCDGETTTQNDRNLGIVNIWVGFAPLKPAEFVVLYLQQMAGQIET